MYENLVFPEFIFFPSAYWAIFYSASFHTLILMVFFRISFPSEFSENIQDNKYSAFPMSAIQAPSACRKSGATCS
jgi:hypothetical protein